jgi:transposase-like protein
VNAKQVFYWRKKYREGRLGKNQSNKFLPVTLSDTSHAINPDEPVLGLRHCGDDREQASEGKTSRKGECRSGNTAHRRFKCALAGAQQESVFRTCVRVEKSEASAHSRRCTPGSKSPFWAGDLSAIGSLLKGIPARQGFRRHVLIWTAG